MAKKKQRAAQWKVINRVHIDDLEWTLDEWTEKGWAVFSVFGAAGNLVVVLQRFLVL